MSFAPLASTIFACDRFHPPTSRPILRSGAMPHCPFLVALDAPLRGGCRTRKLRTGPRSDEQDRRTPKSEVAWSDFTNGWESSRSIDDAPDGRGHCRKFAFGGLND